MRHDLYMGSLLMAAALIVTTVGCGDHAPGIEAEERAVAVKSPGPEHRPVEESIHIDQAARERLGLVVSSAGSGNISLTVELPGEVRVNGNRTAHVAPRVEGVAREVRASLGDRVKKGQVLAVLDSRELADAKADYLSASERLDLAQATYEREEGLWKRGISSEQDYLDASNVLAEARIALRSAEQKLHTLTLTEVDVKRIPTQKESELTRYLLTAPFDGEVIDRHLTIGESVAAGTPTFTIADLSTVWVDLSVYQKDLARVRAGQQVLLRPANDGAEENGTIDFVQPILGEKTRTALARVIRPNALRRWKPGMFVSATVEVDALTVGVRLPIEAIVHMDDGDEVVFLETAEGFVPREVSVGLRGPAWVEITEGIEAGDNYVATGGFSLKAEMAKSSFGHGHGH